MKLFIKCLTVLIVLVLALNPETFPLALFIDAAGIEIVLLLFQLQIIAMGIDIKNKGAKAFDSLLASSKLNFGTPQQFTFSILPEAILMHVLVISAAFGAVYHLV